MKRTFTLRTQIILLMTFLLVMQNFALIMALSSSKIFFMLDAESFRLFNNTTVSRMQSLNKELGKVMSNIQDASKLISSDFQAYQKNYRTYATSPNLDLSYELSLLATDNLIHLLQNNSISGAFILLNPNEKHDLVSVYIRNIIPKNFNSNSENFLLEVGSDKIINNYGINKSLTWQEEFPLDFSSIKKMDFYKKPITSAYDNINNSAQSYGYWAEPITLLPQLQSAIYYTIPILSASRVPVGILGIEISANHFSQYYLPNIDLPYEDSFYIISQVHNDVLSLDWFITGNDKAYTHLPEKGGLALTKTDVAPNIYELNLSGLGDVYTFVQPLNTYSQSSPFINNSWSLVSFVPKATLHDGASKVQNTLTLSIVLTSLLTLAAIFVLAFASTRKIAALSKYVAGLNPHDEMRISRTGMREIDDLSAALKRLNERVVQSAKTTSKILELSLLPIGGFEVNLGEKQVILTEYICYLLGIESCTQISLDEWTHHYQDLIALPAEQYENIYHFTLRDDFEQVWLRILETPTETGSVGVVLDVTKEIEEHKRLLHELDYDNMTHLLNRRAFKREVNSRIRNHPDTIGVMIFSDLDNLKYINDTFGHETGDRLILRASEMFSEFSNEGGIVSRISGDEFAIYLHGFSTKEEVMNIVHTLFKRNELYSLKTPDGVSHRIRFSSGIAWYPEHSGNVTDLLKLSDFAMYEAKHNQKGVLYEFNPVTYQSKAYLLDNREAIHRLIDEKLIHFCFQPIVCLKTGNIYAYESLMRSSIAEFKSPLEILSVASAQSQLGQLERLVFHTAFETINSHIEELRDTQIFINSIPSHLMTPAEFGELKRKYRQVFSQIIIEVTERESDTVDKMSDRLDALKKLGLRFAIDDFGNGYSGEVRILAANPDIVKVDMMLIQGIHKDNDKQQLVSNLISFCHAKGVRLVAEGVEDKADLAKLIELKVDMVQGYYTGKPSPNFEPISPKIKAEILQLRLQYHGL